MSGKNLTEKRKRKKVVVSLEEKYAAIRRLDAGESAVVIAADFGVGKSTVTGWKQNRAEIEAWCSSHAGPSREQMVKRKSMKKSEHEEVSEALFMWFVQNREKGIPLSGPLLREKALHFYEKLEKQPDNDDDKFTASDGWLNRWKKRYNIRGLSICGEKLSAESHEEEFHKFKRHFQRTIDRNGWTAEQLYNCDETGLNFRMLPSKTLVLKQEKSAAGFKKQKERVTVLACSNALGNHQLPLVVIGKSKNPRAFKNIRKQKLVLPVYYTNQKSAWMDSKNFETWFREEFVPQVAKFLKSKRLPREALLLLDNAPSHPDPSILKDGNIRVLFFPPNVTSIGQPMDQGILQLLKMKYRRRLLRYILTDDDSNLIDQLKKVDMLDVVRWISDSWNEIQPISLIRSWRKLLDHQASDKWWHLDSNFEEDEGKEREDETSGLALLVKNIAGCENFENQDVEDWMKDDDGLELTEDDIVHLIVTEKEKEDMSDDDEVEIPNSRITHTEAFQMFEKVLQNAQEQDMTTASDLILLRKWRDFSARKRLTGTRQKTVDDYLIPKM